MGDPLVSGESAAPCRDPLADALTGFDGAREVERPPATTSPTPAYINHVSIALGSHGERETCVEISLRLDYLSVKAKDEVMLVSDSTGRLLNGLMHSLESRLAHS
ncbi:MAG: four helix bundle protein [Acidobacteria bacterium]|nr:four helix bundle protein [Acidobacteriota bacterium]